MFNINNHKGKILLAFIIAMLIATTASGFTINREMKAYCKELEQKSSVAAVEIDFAKIQNRSLQAEIIQLEDKFTLEEEELARLEQERKDKIIAEQIAEEKAKKTKEIAQAREEKGVTVAAAPTRSNTGNSSIFDATAYDLSVASCGKSESHPQYGITASGFSLKGKTLQDRYIAVDRKVIKLGSQVHIEFFEPYTHLTGYYTAVDTGGAIKGDKVDIFFGSGNVHKEAMAFGRRKVKVTY